MRGIDITVHQDDRELLAADPGDEKDAPHPSAPLLCNHRQHQIPGTAPSPRDFPDGDRFAPRSQDPAADPARALALQRIGDADHYWATAAPSTAETSTEGANA